MMKYSAVSSLLVWILSMSLSSLALSDSEAPGETGDNGAEVFKIEGKVTPPDNPPPDWFSVTTVIIDGGSRRAFLRDDNSFVFQGLAPGSYLIEIDNAEFVYEDVRVDINSKGKHRARKNNPVQPNQVTQLPYPIKAKPLGKYRYYEKREEWKITDVLFNPMIMMMVMPLLLVAVLPKMMQDPETKKEMEEMQAKMNVQNQLPDMSEMLTSLWGGAPQQTKKKVPVRRQQQR